MTIQWVACSAKTGIVVTDLAALSVPTVSDLICGYATATATLPMDGAPVDWELATRPKASYLVMLDDETPVWGALIAKRTSSQSDVITLSLQTIPAYFLTRHVGDETYEGVDQCEIVADLIDSYAGDSFPVSTSYTASDYTRNRTYRDVSNKTLFDAITELAGVINGAEWAVTWASSTDGSTGKQKYTPVVQIADRLGSAPMDGLMPSVTFDLPGNVLDCAYSEDFTTGAGANRVVASSTASTDTVPTSDAQTYTDPDRPVYEYRFTPSTSITDVETLNDHAEGALARMREGTRSLSLALDASSETCPCTGYALGDTVGFDLTLPSRPNGLQGWARVTGYKRVTEGTQTVTPTLNDLEVTNDGV